MVVVKNGYSKYPFCKGANPESIVGREGQEIRGDQPRAICVEHSKKNIDQPYSSTFYQGSIVQRFRAVSVFQYGILNKFIDSTYYK